MYLAAARKCRCMPSRAARSANDFAEQARELFTAETNLMEHFNREFLDGKWDHFMDQTVHRLC